jgi:thymidine kinase
MQAKLFFVYGTMNSGKSMYLLAKSHNFDERGIFHILLKPALDTRDEGVIHSRSLPDKKCLILEKDELPINKIMPFLVDSSRRLDWVLIDEAQFLTEEQVNNLIEIVDNCGVSVICYGLRTDSKTRLFEGSKRLFEIADTIEEIKSSCHCGRKTIFNARLDSDGDIDLGGDQIAVGGEDKYLSMCRKCFFDKVFGNEDTYIEEQ